MALLLRPPSSRESLTDSLSALGRSRKLYAVFGGVFGLVAIVVALVLLTGILDAVYHLSPLARALSLVLILTTAIVLWIRLVSRALRLRTDSLSIALELEGKFPTLNDALGSSVSFLDGKDEDDKGVSSRLQAAAVRSARRLVDRHEFGSLIPSASCWRSCWACALVIAVAIPIILMNTTSTAVALVRLSDPYGIHPWPTKTQITIISPAHFPLRMAKGDPFELNFTVRGLITERAVIAFRFANGEEFEEQYPLASSADPIDAWAAVVSARIDPARLPGPFSFRIWSNDADTGWHTVDVVPPPRLIPMNGRPTPHFEITPPAYTGLPVGDLPDGSVVLEVPVGTSIKMQAATDIQLSAASLAYLGDRTPIDQVADIAAIGNFQPYSIPAIIALAKSIGSDIPVSLDTDGRILSAAFAPSMSGMYALKLVDMTGLIGTRLIEIRLVSDPAPVVTLHRPTIEKDPTYLNPTAILPINISVDDRLYGMRQLDLEYRVGRHGSIRSVPIQDFRTLARVAPAIGSGLFGTWRYRPTSVLWKQDLALTAFTREDGTPVRAGDIIWLRSAAADWDDVTPAKEPGRSGQMELPDSEANSDNWDIVLRIASPETIEALLQKELAAIRPELLRLRDQQREARQVIQDVTPNIDGSLQPADRARLLSAEHAQQQILGKIGNPNDARDGILAKANVLRETIRVNKLAKSNTITRVEAVAEELGRLADRELQAVIPTLMEARKRGEQPTIPGQEHAVQSHLKTVVRQQQNIENSLNILLDLLAQWGGAGEIRGEARVLRDAMLRQAEEADRLHEKVPPGKAPDGLSQSQRSNLERLAAKTELATEQAGSLLARAARLAAEKDKLASEARSVAGEVHKQSNEIQNKANALPPGVPERSSLQAQANELKGKADDLLANAKKASDEATALREALNVAGGLALPGDIRKAAEAIQNNRQAEGAMLQRSIASRLDRLIASLTEKQSDLVPDLVKLKKAADELDNLANDQDDLRKRTEAAGQITDPARSASELQNLAREQDKLVERARELLQRLRREGENDAARDTQAALDRMETARNDLERGVAPPREQNDAVQRLDAARDRLDHATVAPAEQLADETRRKLAEKVKSLFERQKSRLAEAERIHQLVNLKQGWERAVQQSYVNLAEEEQKLATELQQLEQTFVTLPVLARTVTDAATAMNSTADRITTRLEDFDPDLAFDAELEAANDRRITRLMSLAMRRLESLHEALKPERNQSNPSQNAQPNTPMPATPSPASGGDQELVPPLTQLKVLRDLQKEVNELTADFAKSHPDRDKLDDEARAELQELEQTQRDIAALVEKLTQLFQERKQSIPDAPKLEKRP
jgi:hypothetical protein